MEEKKTTIKEWIINFLRGEYDAPDVQTQIKAGWYDWFCQDKSLAAKTEKLGRRLIKIAKSKKIDLDNNYVFFKNNCPVNGTLYDDFRICDIKTHDVIYTITPSCGHTHTKGRSEVWGRENEFNEPLLTGTWKDIENFFLGSNATDKKVEGVAS